MEEKSYSTDKFLTNDDSGEKICKRERLQLFSSFSKMKIVKSTVFESHRHKYYTGHVRISEKKKIPLVPLNVCVLPMNS